MASPADRGASNPVAEDIPVAQLFLDVNNPRLEGNLDDRQTDDDLVRLLWRDFAVDEVALSIAHNGYLAYEPLFAVREDGRLVVVEGNRRLAAVKVLLDDRLRAEVRAGDLPMLGEPQKAQLRTLPVVVVESREDIWQYIGFKHVNGPQVWQPLAKARYIADVKNRWGVPLDVIARNIGDRHSTVKRLYRAQVALAQAEQAGVYDIDDRWNTRFAFSHLYTGLDYQSIGQFVGLPDGEASFETATPIPMEHMTEFGDLCLWLWGSKSRNRQPVVKSQNPDLRLLDDAVGTPDGVAALRTGLPLQVAVEIGKGDTRILREVLVSAKQSLQEARGKVLTGYHGEEDLLILTKDISRLARGLVDDMNDVRREVQRSERDDDE